MNEQVNVLSGISCPYDDVEGRVACRSKVWGSPAPARTSFELD